MPVFPLDTNYDTTHQPGLPRDCHESRANYWFCFNKKENKGNRCGWASKWQLLATAPLLTESSFCSLASRKQNCGYVAMENQLSSLWGYQVLVHGRQKHNPDYSQTIRIRKHVNIIEYENFHNILLNVYATPCQLANHLLNSRLCNYYACISQCDFKFLGI